MGRGLTAALALAAIGSTAAVAGAPEGDDAALFGTREGVRQASLSPDGKSVAFVTAGPGRTSLLQTGTPDGGLKTVLRTSGNPDRLEACHWSTDTRLVCSIFLEQPDSVGWLSYTRMISIDADGGNLKLLTPTGNSRSLGFAVNGGQVIDWLGDDAGGKVLMTRVFVPENTINTHLASGRAGLGVERVDTTTGARTIVDEPHPEQVEFITDGHGTVRVHGLQHVKPDGYVQPGIDYVYRLPDGGWKPLSHVSTIDRTGFDPYAVDRDLNVVYGFDKVDGREALVRITLDGSDKREVLLQRSDVDVDGLIRIGRQHRVVGASYATEKRQVQFFDPELKSLSAKLGRALPGLPLVTFVDASDGEKQLLLFAGSDTDPGRYFLYDKATRKLARLLDVRPELAQTKLSPVQPITFPAADGTPIPAYLTLPPGSGTAKGLPAIVMPHGGPSDRDEWGFDYLSQYLAQRGYAVLQPNFRGSSGYGDTWFQKNGFQSWRTAIGDVNDAGRWLVKQGIARPDRLAIFGWSYGGYAALQSAVLDPNLYKAIVAVAPVTDLVQLKTDARKYVDAPAVEAFLGSGPWLREGSPAQNARTITAPVMIFHGDEDQNVAIAQSRLMISRLRATGAKPQFVEYKGLDHQLEDSAARADMLGKADAFLRETMGL